MLLRAPFYSSFVRRTTIYAPIYVGDGIPYASREIIVLYSGICQMLTDSIKLLTESVLRLVAWAL